MTMTLDSDITAAIVGTPKLFNAQRAMAASAKAAQRLGWPVPCLDDPDGGWLSEDESKRAQAAVKCRGCPLRRDCQAVADAASVQWGVYAGVDYGADTPEAELRRLGRDPERRDERDKLIAALHAEGWEIWRLAMTSGLSADWVEELLNFACPSRPRAANQHTKKDLAA